MARIDIVIHRKRKLTADAAEPSRWPAALIDDLVERMWGALQAAKADEAKATTDACSCATASEAEPRLAANTHDGEWREKLHPRAPDGRFGNKAGEHPHGFEPESKTAVAEGLKEKTAKGKLRELLESGHEWNQEELMLIAGIDKEATFKAFIYYMRTPNYSRNAWAMAWDNVHTRNQGAAVTFNESNLTEAGWVNMESRLKGCALNAWHPEKCDTIKSIMDHELGHQMDNLLGLSANPEIVALEEEAKAHGRMGSYATRDNDVRKRNMSGNLSTYADKNRQEFIAEGWAEYRNNPQPRPTAKKIGKIIEAEYAKRFSKK